MKAIIIVGCSGSGKSTWATGFLNNPENQNYIRINRDSIRECLVPNHIQTWYQRPDRDNLEKLVSSIEYDLIDVANYFDKDIIIDATNIDKKRLEAFLAYLKHHYPEVDISIKIMQCKLETAQNRVYRRDYLELAVESCDEYFDYSGMPEVEYIEKQFNKMKVVLDWLKTQNYEML